jgi:membrane protein
MHDLTERGLAWAARRRARIAGHNPYEVTLRVARSFTENRVPGLAAEMAFFALLSFAPMLVATGAALGYLERLVGPEAVERAELAVTAALGAVFSPDMTRDVLAPMVQGLLEEQRGGLAVTGTIVTLWLASRVFTATIRALDLAYDVPERRGLVAQRGLALLFALGAVVVVPLTLGVMVVGPLLGGGQALAGRIGLGDAFATVWGVGRWPVLLMILATFLAWLYRVGPNVDNTWLRCVPGAVLGVVLWVVVSLGFRVYLAAGGPETPRFSEEDEAIALAGRVLGAVVASVLWVWVSSMVVLLGGVLNAELDRRSPPKA